VLAPSKDAAGEEGAELALDEAGDDAPLLAGGGEEGLEMMLHGAVERRGLECVPLVILGLGEAVTGERGIRHEGELVRAMCLRREAPREREKVVGAPPLAPRSRGGRDRAFTGCRRVRHPGRVRCELAHARFPNTPPR
jgi:hypothetical protein